MAAEAAALKRIVRGHKRFLAAVRAEGVAAA